MASIIFFISFFFSLFNISLQISTIASKNVSAVFAFGDSTLDGGNNNHMNTFFRGDHLPYGRDLPQHMATGRFSNGMLSTDYIVQSLGLKDLLPPYYLNPNVSDHDLLTGVTFASGGSGLDNLTIELTSAMDLMSQFKLFEDVLQRLKKSVGEVKTWNVIKKAVFIVSVGTNDLLCNAYLWPTRLIKYANDVSKYHDFLLENLEYFIQKLYGIGARKIVVTGLPPMGCLPLMVTINSMLPGPYWLKRLCNPKQNQECDAYNTKLHSKVHSLEATLKGSKIAFFDIYSPLLDMVQSPLKYGLLEMGPVCNMLDLTCVNASKFLFWDAMHPTQSGYWVLAQNGLKNVLPYVIG
ncbi:hypothetical protein PIB30_003774 [Stylosanthes scabra]|uniref:Uncharacterized protein n=1 Tax=Stylosanthes scabra TaxID=79078 RepID=A0ABU6R419_9FABA|nr:hypothetical protein [Stylosanthes scabra]